MAARELFYEDISVLLTIDVGEATIDEEGLRLLKNSLKEE